MSLLLLSSWLAKELNISKSMSPIAILNEWLEKIVPFMPRGTPYPRSREGGMPPGLPPREGLKWKPTTHRWIRPEEEEVREERIQPRLLEITEYIETGGFGKTAEKTESMLKDLFPDMVNPDKITRIKGIESIQEKEQRQKYKSMTKENAIEREIITEDDEWDGMKYYHFTDIVGGRVSFSNVNQVNDAVKVLQDRQEELGFRIVNESNRMDKPLDGYYRRYHMDVEMDTEDGKTITIELQLGTANQTTIADWAHDLLHKKGKDRPILTSNDRRTALKYITQMSELYAYHDGIEGAKNIYPADCIEVIRKFAGCLDVPEP